MWQQVENTAQVCFDTGILIALWWIIRTIRRH